MRETLIAIAFTLSVLWGLLVTFLVIGTSGKVKELEAKIKALEARKSIYVLNI